MRLCADPGMHRKHHARLIAALLAIAAVLEAEEGDR